MDTSLSSLLCASQTSSCENRSSASSVLRHVNPKDHTISSKTHSAMAQGKARPERSLLSRLHFSVCLWHSALPPTFQLWQWGKKSSIQTINAGFSLPLTFYPKMNHNLKHAVKCNLGFLAVRLHFQRKPMAGRLDFVFANYTFLPRKLPAVQEKK